MSAGSLSVLRKRKAKVVLTDMTPAERMAHALGYRGPVHNFASITDKEAEAAKTARLVGRRNESRTQ